MTIYELTSDLLALQEMAEDPETDPQVLADTMAGTEGALEDKAEGWGKVIKQLESDEASLDEEIRRLVARKKTISNNIDRMKSTLQQVMMVTGKTKFKTQLFSFSICNTPAKVVLDTDEDNIPMEFLIPSVSVDKKRIMEQLKSGAEFDFAHLESGTSMRIR